MLLLLSFVWVVAWRDSDVDMLRKAVGDPDKAVAEAPLWTGRARVQYSDLSSEARSHIDQSRFASLRTWADVCRAFAAVQVPKGKVVNGWVIPPLAQGDGTVRAVQVYVVEEWSGWKLATFQCGPVDRQP